jgi:hypothetical protein
LKRVEGGWMRKLLEGCIVLVERELNEFDLPGIQWQMKV